MGSRFGAICIKCYGLQRIAAHSRLCTGYLLLLAAIRCAKYDILDPGQKFRKIPLTVFGIPLIHAILYGAPKKQPDSPA